MFSRRAPLIGSRPESTVQLISRGGEEAERRYLRSLTIICEQGELKLATRRKDGTKAPPPPPPPPSSSPTPSSSRASPSATTAASATTASSSSPYYELLFKGNIGGGGGGGGTPRSARNSRSCLLSLWRFPPETTTSATTEAEARDRLQVLARLVGVLFSTTTQASRHTQSVQSLQLLFQRLVNSMVGQPGWRAVHIAAHVSGFVGLTFFSQNLIFSFFCSERPPRVLHLSPLSTGRPGAELPDTAGPVDAAAHCRPPGTPRSGGLPTAQGS